MTCARAAFRALTVAVLCASVAHGKDGFVRVIDTVSQYERTFASHDLVKVRHDGRTRPRSPVVFLLACRAYGTRR